MRAYELLTTGSYDSGIESMARVLEEPKTRVVLGVEEKGKFPPNGNNEGQEIRLRCDGLSRLYDGGKERAIGLPQGRSGIIANGSRIFYLQQRIYDEISHLLPYTSAEVWISITEKPGQSDSVDTLKVVDDLGYRVSTDVMSEGELKKLLALWLEVKREAFPLRVMRGNVENLERETLECLILGHQINGNMQIF